MNFLKKNNQGFVALVSLLMVAALGLTIAIAVSLSGLDELLVSLGNNRALEAHGLAQTCAEEGLEKLRNDFVSYSTSLSIDGNSCIISAVVSGNSALLHATGTVDVYSQKIEVSVDSDLNVTNWQED